MKDIISKKSYAPAVAFYEKAEKELFPALASHDAGKIKMIMEDLRKDYETHRQAIDELVKIADDQNKANEANAAETIRNQTLLLITIMLITVLAAAIVAYMITKNLLYEIGGEPYDIAEVADKVAHGDLTVTMASSGNPTGICSSMESLIVSYNDTLSKILVTSNDTVSAVDALRTRNERIKEGAVAQAGQASQIAASAEEMSQTIIDIAKNAAAAAETFLRIHGNS